MSAKMRSELEQEVIQQARDFLPTKRIAEAHPTGVTFFDHFCSVAFKVGRRSITVLLKDDVGGWSLDTLMNC